MSPRSLAESWGRTRAHLVAAESRLAADTDLVAYREYLSHNELGLAFEELVDRAEAAAASAAWPHLDAAAREMDLYAHDSPHARSAARCRRHAEAAG